MVAASKNITFHLCQYLNFNTEVFSYSQHKLTVNVKVIINHEKQIVCSSIHCGSKNHHTLLMAPTEVCCFEGSTLS